jgi:hypothetical protein
MRSGTALAATVFALASIPLLAQQPSPASPAGSPASQQSPAGAQSPSQSAAVPTAQTAAPAMSPVNGELLSKLDSKTAKTGDGVVIKTETLVKTADGTAIPKGSKLMGHIIAVQPSTDGKNSQVALQFDRVELQGGQTLGIHSQIQSIAPAGISPTDGSSSNGASAAQAPAPTSSNPGMNGANGNRASGAQQSASGNPEASNPAGTAIPAPGTVVAKNGNIAISTTAIPGLLLANNAPGEQDPRMAQASSILLGARKDIQLDGGTQLVVGVAAAGGGTR